MTGTPGSAHKLLQELYAWLQDRAADPDDAVPAMLVLSARIAHANGKSLDLLTTMLRNAYHEAGPDAAVAQRRQ